MLAFYSALLQFDFTGHFGSYFVLKASESWLKNSYHRTAVLIHIVLFSKSFQDKVGYGSQQMNATNQEARRNYPNEERKEFLPPQVYEPAGTKSFPKPLY